PRRRPLRWLRTTLLYCWSLIALYLGSTAFNLYQLAHDNLAVLLDWEKVRPALTLPGPLDSANTPLWADAASGVAFLRLFGACLWATLDARAEGRHHLTRTVRDVLRAQGVLPLPAASAPAPLPAGPPFDDLGAPDDDHFVGRVADLDWVLARLREHRLAA